MRSGVPGPAEHAVALDGGWTMWRLAAVRSAGIPFHRLAVLAAGRELAMPPGSARDRALAERTTTGVDRLLLDDTLRAAMTWQSPALIDNWVGHYVAALRAGNRPRLDRMSRREALVARYAQRYCAKNDTIGFFGPVAWAHWHTEGSGIATTAGDGGHRRSAVHLETWAVQALERTWRHDPHIRPHLPVRLDPACWLVDGTIRRPHRQPVRLGPGDAEIVAAFDEAATIGRLRTRFGDRVAAVLDRLSAERVVDVGFPIPFGGSPGAHLRRQLASIEDESVRDRLVRALDRIEEGAEDLAKADCPERLRDALGELDRRFAKAAGQPVPRSGGATPGGRTPVYLDCRRDLDVTIGRDLLDLLAAPLGVLLDSARWLVGEAGEVVSEALLARYRDLRTRMPVVTLADLQFAAADVLAPGGDLLSDVVADFQLRWKEILDHGEEVPVPVARRLADALFPAGGRTWAAARVHSPDLMLRAGGAGGPRWVLGELHLALNTLESRVFRDQADDPDELVRAVAADMPAGRVVPLYPRAAPEASSRTYPPLALDPPDHYRYWSYGSDDGHGAGGHGTPATALVVAERDGELVASARDHGWEAPVLECFGEFVTALVVNLFRPRPPARHAPRVTIGDLVVCRRTWRVPVAELGRVPHRGADPGHDRLRRWARDTGLPRHVFARTVAEAKPFYVDFDAPALVDNLARAARRVAAWPAGQAYVELVEMLPAPDELWLTGSGGEAYTAELRVVTVDPVPPSPPSWALPFAEQADG